MRKVSLAILSLVITASVIGGCAGVGSVSNVADEGEDQILWPALPDQPRFRFVGILRSAKDVVEETESDKMKRQLTQKGPISDAPVIYKPSGIAVRSGLVYVAEPAVNAITVFDLPRRKLFRFGMREPNSLKTPQSIAVDRNGLVFVLDSELKKVMVFDNLGLFIRAINVKEGFTNPVAVAVTPDGKTIYVVDRGDVATDDHKVVAFTEEGKEKFRLGPRGQEEGRFNIPLAAAVASDNTLYVVDSGNFRVQAFDGGGKFKFQFGRVGMVPGSFARPKSIAIDPAGNVYVADATFNNVQIFNSKGELLMPLGATNREPGPGRYMLLANVAVDERGQLFVEDHFFRKIDVFVPIPEEEGRRLQASQTKYRITNQE